MKKRILSITVAVAAVISLIGASHARADFVPDNVLDMITEDEILDDTVLNDGEISEDASADAIDDAVFTDATVNVHMLNLRCGASIDYSIIHVLNKGDTLKVFGKFNDWYIVQDEKTGKVGCVNAYYISLKTHGGIGNDNTQDNSQESVLSEPERLLKLVNEIREQNGLSALTLSSELSRVASHKALDMVENNYFAHNSPVYGTPFEMMKKYGINFSLAAENIAGNQSAEGAAFAWTNSEGHLANILNSDYTTAGIGICSSPIYGKIYVQLFTD